MSATGSGRVTVALVHGAFADSSSWNGVVELLLKAGISVQAIPNPLRGIGPDSAYVAKALAQIPGQVLAVGHSYGGAIITNAATGLQNVVGLVYVAAFAPAEKEVLADIEADSKDSVLNSALVTREYPIGDGDETAIELFIDPAQFHQAFAADVTREQAAIMAATQRPVAARAFSDPNGPPAFESLPSWAAVATSDTAAGSDVVRSMAARAGARVTEISASHVVMISQPRAVTDVILEALGSFEK